MYYIRLLLDRIVKIITTLLEIFKCELIYQIISKIKKASYIYIVSIKISSQRRAYMYHVPPVMLD